MQVGTRVKYIRVDTEKDKATGYYPPVGTLGTVIEAHEEDIFVKWDSGTTGEGEWWCYVDDVEELERTIKVELTESEFKMIIDKLKWMGCVVKNGNLNYENYCNGECGEMCDRPNLGNFGEWFKSKIIG